MAAGGGFVKGPRSQMVIVKGGSNPTTCAGETASESRTAASRPAGRDWRNLRSVHARPEVTTRDVGGQQLSASAAQGSLISCEPPGRVPGAFAPRTAHVS